MTCPHLDVRRPQGRGAKLGVTPKTLPLHPGATGKGKIGRVNTREPLVMLRNAELRIDATSWRSAGTRRCDAASAGR
jgi:hypothetical protein